MRAPMKAPSSAQVPAPRRPAMSLRRSDGDRRARRRGVDAPRRVSDRAVPGARHPRRRSSRAASADEVTEARPKLPAPRRPAISLRRLNARRARSMPRRGRGGAEPPWRRSRRRADEALPQPRPSSTTIDRRRPRRRVGAVRAPSVTVRQKPLQAPEATPRPRGHPQGRAIGTAPCRAAMAVPPC